MHSIRPSFSYLVILPSHYATFVPLRHTPLAWQAEALRLFDHFDEDGSGQMEFDEFCALLASLPLQDHFTPTPCVCHACATHVLCMEHAPKLCHTCVILAQDDLNQTTLGSTVATLRAYMSLPQSVTNRLPSEHIAVAGRLIKQLQKEGMDTANGAALVET